MAAPSVVVLLLGYAMLVVSKPVNLEYLGRHERHSQGNERDLYFCCNVQGPSMLWTINGISYGSFMPTELAVVHRESLPNFNYTTTLLSSRTDAGVHQLDSVMIVSVEGNITINVGCVSDTGSDFSNNTAKSTMQLLQANSSESPAPVIQMFQLWQRSVIRNDNTNTTCLMCEVIFRNQFWWTNKGDVLGFDSEHSIGSEFHLPSTDNNFLRLQTILIALPPGRLISIFLLTDSSVSNVTCNAGDISVSSAELRSVHPTTPDVTTSDVTTAIVDAKHTFETAAEDHTQPSSDQTILRDTSMGSTVTIAISVILPALFIAVVMAVAILLIVKMRWKNSRTKDMNRANSNAKLFGQSNETNYTTDKPGIT